MTIEPYQTREHKGESGAPLIFAFHGTGGDENQFFNLAQQILPDASVIAPRGDVSEHGAARFFKRTGEGVYDMEDLSERTDKMTSYIQTKKSENPGVPVYGFGYSNGANILASVSLANPNLFDRIALLHPLIPWKPDPVDFTGKTKVLITAGQRDPICPLPMSNALIDWYGENGAEVVTEIHEGGHELRQIEIDVLASFLRG